MQHAVAPQLSRAPPSPPDFDADFANFQTIFLSLTSREPKKNVKLEFVRFPACIYSYALV